MRRVLCAAGLVLGFVGTAAANPVTDAMATSLRLSKEAGRGSTGLLNQPRSPLIDAHWSRLAAAMFEASAAADGGHRGLLGLAPSGRPADVDAAVMAAAHGVLVHAFPGKKAELDDTLAFNLAQRPSGAARDEGVRLGAEAARLANAREVYAANATPWRDQPQAELGRFVGSAEPMTGNVWWGYRPWLVGDMKAIKVGAFPDLKSATYADSYEETRRLGAKDSKERTTHQSALARFWLDGLDWVPTLRNLAAKGQMSTAQVARLNALQSLAVMDAFMLVDLNKFGEARWRPATAIRRGDDDGNDRTTGDKAWQPYLRTPNNGEFPCGHCTTAAVMGSLFGAELGEYSPEAEFASDDTPGMVIRGMRWADLGRQASMSRIYGGVHFRYSAEVGEAFGREIARVARANFLRATVKPKG